MPRGERPRLAKRVRCTRQFAIAGSGHELSVESALVLGYREVLSNGAFCVLLAIQVAFAIGLFQFMVALPLAMAEQGLSAGAYGGAMAVNGVLIALLSPWASRATSKRDAGRTLALAAGLVAAGYGAYAMCKTPLQFAGATAIWSLGEIIALPKLSALVATMSPVELRGRYQGLFSLSFGVSLALAPAIGGVVVARMGAHAHWGGVAVLCTLVAIAHLVAGQARRRAGAG